MLLNVFPLVGSTQTQTAKIISSTSKYGQKYPHNL
jgi:hypothetical protein